MEGQVGIEFEKHSVFNAEPTSSILEDRNQM